MESEIGDLSSIKCLLNKYILKIDTTSKFFSYSFDMIVWQSID